MHKLQEFRAFVQLVWTHGRQQWKRRHQQTRKM